MRKVLVIGAGIIGGSIAWRLAQAGYRVALFDANRFGGGASWAGAGMLAPGSEFPDASPHASIWTALANESMSLYPGFVAELEAESRMPIDFRICGSRAGAQVYPADGLVDPRDVMIALRRACELRGVGVHENSPISDLDTDDQHAVVVAAGAWSSSIASRYQGRAIPFPESFPIKGHLIAYQQRPGLLGPIRRSGRTYVLQRANGLVVAGSTEERVGFNRKIDSRICGRLHQRAARLWPELSGKLFEECWVGFRPATANGLPEIGRIAGTNVWLAYGHYRNGILLAPVTAAKIAEDIVSA